LIIQVIVQNTIDGAVIFTIKIDGLIIVRLQFFNICVLFCDDYIAEIKILIENCIKEGCYLQADCSLSTFSTTVDVPAHHLTYYFNDIVKIKFTDWKNDLRIAYAMNLMNSASMDTLTLEAIAEQSGFTSRSTFIRAFKNKTKLTPSDYIKHIKLIAD
jgi:AraC-like DNA-binding protein